MRYYGQQHRKPSNRVVFLAIFVPMFIFLAIYGAYNYRLNTGRDARIAPFQAHIATYSDKAAVCPTCPLCKACDVSYREALVPGDTVPMPQTETGYLQGKVVVVDIREQFVTRQMLDLPAEIQPATPDEVESALWVDCIWSQVGTYTRGGGAYRRRCELTVVDLTVPAVVGGKSLVGSEPWITNVSSQDQYGSDLADEVLAYIAGLPRRGAPGAR